MSDSKGAAIRDKLYDIIFEYRIGVLPEHVKPDEDADKAIDAILALLAQEVNKARIDEVKRMWAGDKEFDENDPYIPKAVIDRLNQLGAKDESI